MSWAQATTTMKNMFSGITLQYDTKQGLGHLDDDNPCAFSTWSYCKLGRDSWNTYGITGDKIWYSYYLVNWQKNCNVREEGELVITALNIIKTPFLMHVVRLNKVNMYRSWTISLMCLPSEIYWWDKETLGLMRYGAGEKLVLIF